MKKVFSLIGILFNLLIAEFAFAQAPSLMNYQGVALNASGSPIANSTIKLRVKIHTGTPTGTVQYLEERSVITDATGLFNFQIDGPGKIIGAGTLNSMNWAQGNKYIQIEMDPNNGTAYTDMGTQQLVTVPYAYNAKEAASLTSTAVVNLSNISSSGATSGSVMQHNGTTWVAAPIHAALLPLNDTDANLTSFKITNTTSGGTAIHGKSTHTNPNSVGILGEGNGGSSVGVKATNTSGFAILAESSPTGNYGVIKATSNNATYGYGVHGTSNGASGYGVYGESTAGTGVTGYGNNATATGVYGTSLAGTGVKAYSFTGNALEVNGKLKIAGGNTNPSAGAVLTSDAVGNATWEAPAPKVAFKAQNVSQTATSGTANNEFSDNTYKKVEFYSEDYDLNSNFSATGSNASSSTSSTFLVPVNGVYHFSSAITAQYNYLFDFIKFKGRLMLKRGTTTTVLAESIVDGGSILASTVNISIDKNLLAGDRIWVEFLQSNYSVTAVDLEVSATTNYFTGHLVYAD